MGVHMLVELKKKNYEFKYDGELIKLKAPSVLDVEFLQEEMKKNGESISVVLGFLEKIGLKKEISQEMEVEHINLIVETVVGEKKR